MNLKFRLISVFVCVLVASAFAASFVMFAARNGQTTAEWMVLAEWIVLGISRVAEWMVLSAPRVAEWMVL